MANTESKEKEVKVSQIKIVIGKKEIELTLDEAKKLKSSLEELFGKEIIKEVNNNWWYKYWDRPLGGIYYGDSKTGEKYGNDYKITCQDSTNMIVDQDPKTYMINRNTLSFETNMNSDVQFFIT